MNIRVRLEIAHPGTPVTAIEVETKSAYNELEQVLEIAIAQIAKLRNA